MHKQWIGCSAQNFRPNRGAFQPEAVVLHRTGGSLSDIDARCNQAGTFSSADYAVGTDGLAHQYVEESGTAFHAGVVVSPTWRLIKPGQNPNLYTIGIELAGNVGERVTDAQYDAAASLSAEILRRYQIAFDADHVVLHSEIRADRDCPGSGFDHNELLKRIQVALTAPAQPVDVEFDVQILRNSNVREGAPSTSVRIVRVAAANTSLTVAGFTDQGERVDGNSYWYRTQDGNYVWAGATDAPNPGRPSQSQPALSQIQPATPVSSAPVGCGIPRIDQLFNGAVELPLTGSESDPGAIGAVQDLLSGLGFPGLPTVLSNSYGVFGPKTMAAVASFRQQQGLDAVASVDTILLRTMIATPALDPRASTVYTALVLGFEPTGMHRILSLVSQMEGAGRFAALNRNTDRAGLSFGLIQWAQKPGRLAEILAAMFQAGPDLFVSVFGAGDPGVAAALIAHCRKPSGGLVSKTGDTTNPSFDLVTEPWISRFRQAALDPRFQQVQVRLALDAFNSSYQLLRQYAPDLVSERSVGFMLDVANQFGDGGAQGIYKEVRRPGMDQTAVLDAVGDMTVARVDDAFKTAVRARRDHFLETSLLSDELFSAENVRAAAGGTS